MDNTISASMPVDRATMERMCYILEQPKSLKEITFTPPLNPNVYRLENEISETLVWFFGLSMDLKSLERVVLPLEFRAGIRAIFHRLGDLPKLKSLTLTIRTSYDYMSPSLRPGLDEAVRKGIKSLTRLEEVTLPATMVHGKLGGVLNRLFDASVSSYDGTTIRYYRIIGS